MNEATEIAAARARLRAIGLFEAKAIDAAPLTRLGGLTNRNWRVEIAGDRLVLRIPGEGTSAYIDRRAEKHNAEVAARAGALLFFDADGNRRGGEPGCCRGLETLGTLVVPGPQGVLEQAAGTEAVGGAGGALSAADRAAQGVGHRRASRFRMSPASNTYLREIW